MAAARLLAFGDESGSSYFRDPNVYIMGAVIIPDDRVGDARALLSAFGETGFRKFHWIDADTKEKDAITNAIVNSGIVGVAIVRLSDADERAERRRRKCFRWLTVALREKHCYQLTLESRSPKQDFYDFQMLSAMRSSAEIDSRFRLDHVRGKDDPLLWAADALCGAVVAERHGDPSWLDTLKAEVKVISVAE
ncbi:MAG: hypothetical protein LBB58_03550 [Cellulomonadaceae bacterium]|jgi:hypothetical protein|nr:hypothetical protein [Cellulomonadaceae bacterium]